MSVAASGAGGSDDDKNGGGEKKMKTVPVLDFNNTEEDDDDEMVDDTGDQFVNTEDDNVVKRAKIVHEKPDLSRARRGLSRSYMGKSKSFKNLMKMGVRSAGEFSKKEHPLNIRRRSQIQIHRKKINLLSSNDPDQLATSALHLLSVSTEGDDGKAKEKGKEQAKKKDNDDSKNQEDGN